ncbi:START domain-containing protein [Pseudomonas putida]|uniref:START domain-containing protein n=1 Tax=Pseudomonas putida TaxID=303 RepID=A0A7W2QHY5_PSEPU|nr:MULTISPECIES: START domain-containing protein [Pseudomonas]MBA6115285.1 START domain-containing protein [Pseudomonas putida]MBI6939899.1 START domain-containing protein [Pseudomonas putida]MBI6956131.1 START domain-containing protein [Pseudomonas putida]MCZ9639467.1 START domain-containing protein [Pseudomonas putida]MEC4878130.1 START domain-containing protein [Pseudomonas sp. NC26]
MNRSLLLAALLLCTCAQAADDWNLAYDREGIRVYLRGVADSPYQQFRGVSTIKASVNTLIDMQENLRVACKWLYACDQMRLLEVDGDSTWVYLTTNLPWPTLPRDIILKVTTERLDDGTLVRHLSAEPKKLPETPGLIRVQHLSGEWIMKPLGARMTEVTYQLEADPAGDVPGWLANRFVVDAPLVTLRTLRAVAERQP